MVVDVLPVRLVGVAQQEQATARGKPLHQLQPFPCGGADDAVKDA